jgi:hypothetical protein
MVKDAEDYIDSVIIEKFDKTPYRTINIEMCYVNFNYSPKLKKVIGTETVGVSRKHMMQDNLVQRYKDAGWEVTYDLDDGGDMNGCDYMVLKGKN